MKMKKSTTMAGISGSFLIGAVACLLVAALFNNAASGIEKDDVYVVYMGGSNSNVKLHTELVTSLSERVVHTYVHGFLGFAARLTDEEAKSISKRPEVVSIFRDKLCALHTTRSWDFLEQQITGVVSNVTIAADAATSYGEDTIIGILDSGIWPDSESFSDVGMPPIPSRWKGICMTGTNFANATCNRKLIGARFYDDLSPCDTTGHGTHVASTAAGRFVSGASYYGLAGGTARGGSPNSRIAVYRVCLHANRCLTSYILQAFEDAIADGVDVISVSLGHPYTDFSTDPIAIGSFHAVERGITVVCSAGNNGPDPGSVTNAAPWILTVAATTIDRVFETEVVLGGNGRIKGGGGINFSNLLRDPIYPLIDGLTAKLGSSQSDDDLAARSCTPGSLDDTKVRGRIIVCENLSINGAIDAFDKLLNEYEIKGMIVISGVNNVINAEETISYGSRPVVVIGQDDRAGLLQYIKSNSKPMATILPTVAALNSRPAPVVASFSSRGPGPAGIIKPDIAAPGVNILAAWPGFITDKTIMGREPPRFALLSGTSMACPHVSGLAARVKSEHPTWGPSAIKSAFMTTATNANNLGSEITIHTGERATAYDIGAGEITMSGPIQPGLLYEIDMLDYISFMCSIGYELEKIKLIAPDIVGENFTCPASFEMNYPSLSISKLKKGEVRAVARSVANVGKEDTAYEALVDSPAGLDVQVVPNRLHFTKGVQRLEFKVIFKMKKRTQGAVFGSISWINEENKVRSPFVVTGGLASRGANQWLITISSFICVCVMPMLY